MSREAATRLRPRLAKPSATRRRSCSGRASALQHDLARLCRAAIGRFPDRRDRVLQRRRALCPRTGSAAAGRKDVEEDYRGSFDVQEALDDERLDFLAMGHLLAESTLDNVGDPWWHPIGALESAEWVDDEPALLVDYRPRHHGIRDRAALSHLVTEEGVKPPSE